MVAVVIIDYIRCARSRHRENKEEGISHRDIVISGLLFMLTSLLVLEKLVGHCREFKRKEFLNQGVLKFNAFMNILFQFSFVREYAID